MANYRDWMLWSVIKNAEAFADDIDPALILKGEEFLLIDIAIDFAIVPKSLVGQIRRTPSFLEIVLRIHHELGRRRRITNTKL